MKTFIEYLENAASAAARELYKTRASTAAGDRNFRLGNQQRAYAQPRADQDTSGLADRMTYGPGDYDLDDPNWFEKMYGAKMQKMPYSGKDAAAQRRAMARRAKWDKPYLGDDKDVEYGLEQELAKQRSQEMQGKAWPPSPEDVASAKPFGTDRDVHADMMKNLDARRSGMKPSHQQAQEIKRLAGMNWTPRWIAWELGIPVRHVADVLGVRAGRFT